MTSTLSKEQLTQEILREYLAYNETTGMLTWSKKPNTKCNVNCRAGSFNKNTGYRNITLFGKGYPEHHVIWCWYHGYWPKHQIDHEDHNRTNNAIANLREVTVAQNARNRTRRIGTTVEEAGIWFCRKRKRYVAEITMNGKKVYQKTWKAEHIETAIQERKTKLIELGFHENHGS